MSVILERAAKNMERIEPKLRADVDSKPISALLRRDTWADHERAQYSPFEMALAMGTISVEGHGALMAQVYPVYKALEERIATLADDPIVGQFHIDELNRVPFIEADLAFYYGDDWRDKIESFPTTDEYVERIMTVDTTGFVAHHYTRYMADLSGGLMIVAALKKSWGEDHGGLTYYDFSSVGDSVGFKNAYRQALDELPLDADGKVALVSEVMVAYEMNIEMASILEQQYLEPASA
ncbi:MAG TPA: biliverdin-producing heme oxygenase [Actinomycetota bacterium]